MRATLAALFNSIRNILGVIDVTTQAAHTAAGGLTPYAQAFASVGEMLNDTVNQSREELRIEHQNLLKTL